MMDLPSHLRALPPSAVDVIRYLNKLDMKMAGVEDICEEVGLSERGFGKAIRSLVTKGYVVMDGDQIYRLTDQGSDVAEEIDLYFGDEAILEGTTENETFTRRLVLVMPGVLVANQAARVIVGFHPLAEQKTTAEVVVRVSVINGEPENPQEAIFDLTGAASWQDFLITPGAYSRVRVKAEAYQLGANPGDAAAAGGLYVDADVIARGEAGALAAYGADITIEQQG
jgi:predicted transcriptional regulator